VIYRNCSRRALRPQFWNRLFALGLIGFGLACYRAGLAEPPLDSSTAEAKHHYQSAVAAIAKSDWNTASMELQKAAKLAPRNALVHYDLALAYAHTEQVPQAKEEVQTAIDLGLPADQVQAAQDLKKRLNALPASKKPESSSRADNKASPAHKGPERSAVIQEPDVAHRAAIELSFQHGKWRVAFQQFGDSTLVAGFGVPGGCNQWFTQAASFNIDNQRRVTFPYKATCPFQPLNSVVPVWVITDLAQGSVVTLSLDGASFVLTNEQLQQIKEFAAKFVPQAATAIATMTPSDINSELRSLASSIDDKLPLVHGQHGADYAINASSLGEFSAEIVDGTIKVVSLRDIDAGATRILAVRDTDVTPLKSLYALGDNFRCIPSNEECRRSTSDDVRTGLDAIEWRVFTEGKPVQDSFGFGPPLELDNEDRDRLRKDFYRLFLYAWYQSTFVEIIR
jgi:hypothetical protein